MTKHVPTSEMRQSQDRRRITLPLAPPLEQRRLQIYIMLLLLDGAAVMGGLCTASWLYLGRFLEESSLLHGQVLVPIYWTIALSIKVYSLQALRQPYLCAGAVGPVADRCRRRAALCRICHQEHR